MSTWPKKYDRDPIVEAMFVMRFHGERDLPAVVTAIRQKLDDFQGAGHDGWWVDVTAHLEQHELKVSATPRFHSRVLSTKDAQWRLALADQHAALHVVRPYVGWAKFHEQISKVFPVVLAEYGLANLVELTMRYVDHLRIPPNEPLGRWFDFGVQWPKELPAPTSFQLQLRASDEKRQFDSDLTVGNAATKPDAGMLVILFDLALSRRVGRGGQPVETWLQHAADLHGFQREMFEHSIRDDLRKLLGAQYGS